MQLLPQKQQNLTRKTFKKWSPSSIIALAVSTFWEKREGFMFHAKKIPHCIKTTGKAATLVATNWLFVGFAHFSTKNDLHSGGCSSG